MKMSRLEKIALLVSFFLLWGVLGAFAGGPIFSDEFLYINAGLVNQAEPNYGNRFFHVYLQKLFVDLAPTPLWGIRFFWGFLIALTVVLIYINARGLLKKSNVLHGLLAVAFFFTFSLITEYSGEPAVDITAMTMTIIYVTFFLIAMREPAWRYRMLVLLGALAFLSFKTKETTLFINMLLLGFLFDEDGCWYWRRAAGLVKPLLIGLAAAVGLFIILDGLILGDPFFAISPATFGAVFNNYSFEPGFFIDPVSWYRVYFLNEILLVFWLYIISGVALRNRLSPPMRLLWIYPLVLAAFITLNMLKVTFGYIERFFFPALPVLAVLAPQFLRFDPPQTRRQWVGFGALLALSALLLLALRSAMMAYSASLDFAFPSFLDSIFYPFILSLLFSCVLWAKRYSWAGVVVPLFCLAAMLFNPLTYSYKYFFLFPKVQERYDEIFYPFGALREELALGDGDVLLVSASLRDEVDMLRDDPNEIVGMYNFFFDARIDRENVVIAYNRDTLPDSLTRGVVTRAIISWGDWQWLSEQPEVMVEIGSNFLVSADLEENYVFLTAK
jgi:hypothetical protein